MGRCLGDNTQILLPFASSSLLHSKGRLFYVKCLQLEPSPQVSVQTRMVACLRTRSTFLVDSGMILNEGWLSQVAKFTNPYATQSLARELREPLLSKSITAE